MEEQEFNKKVLSCIKLEPVHDEEQRKALFKTMTEIIEQQQSAINVGDSKKHDELQMELKAVSSELFKNFKFIKPDGNS